MLSNKTIIRISALIGVISWTFLVVTDLVILFSKLNDTHSGIPDYAPVILLITLILSIFHLFKFHLKETDSVNILDLLWRVFVTGLVATIISLVVDLLFFALGSSKIVENPLLINFFYHVKMGTILIFLISTFIVWKRFVLYQKSRSLIRMWQIFEYTLFASLFFLFLDYHTLDLLFNIILSVLVIMGIVLSVNLKWVAYLNFKQKWKSILLILLVILYLWYFLSKIIDAAYDYGQIIEINLIENASILALFAFIFIYAVFSLLVILFNLPTSSVFEQKLEEVINFQRLSQSRYTGQNEDQIYDILLESTVSAVMANAAWLEIQNKDSSKRNMTWKITNEKIEIVKKNLNTDKIKNILSTDPVRNIRANRFTASLNDPDFKSLLVFPLYVQNRQIGTLFLLKDVNDGFNKDVIEIIKTFVNQACISIENFRLLEEAIENERYKEELKIAKRVQKSLLPERLELNEDFKIAALSKAADEVGGDYYDTYRLDQDRFIMIIGDVSGKGTSAAFNMSQMKGVFHSLVHLDLSPQDFLHNANRALSRCLEKTSFITATYLKVNTSDKSIEFARAGHCPTLYYRASEKKGYYFKEKGLGLGILRNDNFSNYVSKTRINYESDDVLVLFTDGLTEAKNSLGEQFGYERLKTYIEQNAYKSPEKLQGDLIEEIFKYCGISYPDDDYTTMVIKFI
mgnify:CR=1 FL=1